MGSISVALSRSGTPDEAVVEEMIRAAPHRGGRIKMIQHGSASLAVAASEDRDDAHLGVDGDVAVALAGTVDNLTDVAREARLAGRVPQSLEPADILMAAYRAFGLDLPARLRGAFGGVVSDRARIIAFRDHLGFGPVFFGRDARGCVSHRRPSRSPPVPVWPRSRISTSARRSISRPMTSTPRARSEEWSDCRGDGSSWRTVRAPDSGATGIRRIDSSRGDYGPDEIKDRFDHLMGQAVARTLTGQDAVSLSGGIDSPAVAAYGASRHLEMAGRPLGGVSAVFPDFPAVDESEYTRLVADASGDAAASRTGSMPAPSIGSTNGPGSPMDPCPRSRFPSTRSTTGSCEVSATAAC